MALPFTFIALTKIRASEVDANFTYLDTTRIISVNASGGSTGLTFNGGPITSGTGTLTLAGTLGAGNGGTGQAAYAVGDVLYASGTGALSRLPVGGAGTVLGVNAGIPAWQTVSTALGYTPLNPANNGSDFASLTTTQTNLGIGLVKLSTGTTAAGVAGQWVVLPTPYTQYLLLLDNFVPATSGSNLGLQFSTNHQSTTLGAAQYGYFGQEVVSTPTATTIGNGAANYLLITNNQLNTASIGSFAVVTLMQPSATSRTRVTLQSQYADAGVVEAEYTGGGFALGTTRLTDLFVVYSAGNIGVSAQSATWALYGYL